MTSTRRYDMAVTGIYSKNGLVFDEHSEVLQCEPSWARRRANRELKLGSHVEPT